jgi:hypothetical protein
MPTRARVELVPITAEDIDTVARFLCDNLGCRGGVDGWASAIRTPWPTEQPNHGFLLREEGAVVGVHLAFYSQRELDGQPEQLCNLAAWCVLPTHRQHGFRLLRALLAQRGYHFTDFSPSGNVVALNLRLGFEPLDTTTALVPNLPLPARSGNVRLSADPDELARRLRGRDLDIYRDHVRAPAAHHLLLTRGEETCHVIFRRDRRKSLPLFASIVHVSNQALFQIAAGRVYRHLLLRHGIPLTLNELRVVGSRPRFALMLRSSRPKMYRSTTLRPEQIDYLYSELACVAW